MHTYAKLKKKLKIRNYSSVINLIKSLLAVFFLLLCMLVTGKSQCSIPELQLELITALLLKIVYMLKLCHGPGEMAQ